MHQQILFIQGGGESVHDAWDNRLVASLAGELGPGADIRYPRMPDEADPDAARWTAAIAAELARLDAGAIAVGHSLGGAILIHALAELQPARRLAGIFLIAAPFIGPGGWPSDDIPARPELGRLLPQGVPVFLYHGSADATAPVAHLDLYARVLPQAVVRRLDGRDHQLNDDLRAVADDIRSLRQRM
jgi:predicted alpha/beta hydrolase family esterase